MTSVPVDRLVVALEERRAALIDVIRRARREITLSLFRCNDEEIFAELAAATARGVDVDVLVTSRSKGGPRRRQKLWDGLERKGAAGVNVEIYSANRVAGLKSHGKIMVIDDRLLVVGSMALSAMSLDFRREVSIVVEEPSAIAEARRLFASADAPAPEPPSAGGGAAE